MEEREEQVGMIIIDEQKRENRNEKGMKEEGFEKRHEGEQKRGGERVMRKHIREEEEEEEEEEEGNRGIDQKESKWDEGKEGESRGRPVWRKTRRKKTTTDKTVIQD